jgi:hypothetical protein
MMTSSLMINNKQAGGLMDSSTGMTTMTTLTWLETSTLVEKSLARGSDSTTEAEGSQVKASLGKVSDVGLVLTLTRSLPITSLPETTNQTTNRSHKITALQTAILRLQYKNDLHLTFPIVPSTLTSAILDHRFSQTLICQITIVQMDASTAVVDHHSNALHPR